MPMLSTIGQMQLSPGRISPHEDVVFEGLCSFDEYYQDTIYGLTMRL